MTLSNYSKTQEAIKKALNSPKAEQFVRNRIEAVQPNKNIANAVIAGQAVSSAVVEFLGLTSEIGITYNDVDVFKPIEEKIAQQIRNTKKSKYEDEGDRDKAVVKEVFSKLRTREATTATINEIVSATGAYGHIYCVANPKIKILGTVRDGDINTTYMSMAGTKIGLGEEKLGRVTVMKVIERFDINATQIGYEKNNIGSGLVYTQEFVSFLVTKQLEVSRWNTPLHSLARLGKKAKELGVHANMEEATLISLGYVQANRSLNKEFSKAGGYWDTIDFMDKGSTQLPLNFGTKVKDTLEELKIPGVELIEVDKEKKLYTVKTSKKNSDNLFADVRKWDGGIMMSSKNLESALEEAFSGEITWDTAGWDYGTKSVMSLGVPDIYKNIKHAKKSMKKTLKKVFHERENKGSHKDLLQMNTLMDFKDLKVEEIIKYEDLKGFIYGANGHKELTDYLLEMDKLKFPLKKRINILENIKKTEKEYKVFVGKIAGMDGFEILKECEKLEDIEYCRTIAKNYLKEAKIIQFEDRLKVETEDYFITEINSLLELLDEGREQRNCVGGYLGTIKNKDHSAIYSIIPKDKESGLQRVTLEIRKNETGDQWKIIQAEGFPVKGIVLNDELVEALAEINKKQKMFPFYFGSYVTKEAEGEWGRKKGNYLKPFAEENLSEEVKRRIFAPEEKRTPFLIKVGKAEELKAKTLKALFYTPVRKMVETKRDFEGKKAKDVSIFEMIGYKILKKNESLIKKWEAMTFRNVFNIAVTLSSLSKNKDEQNLFDFIQSKNTELLVEESLFYSIPIEEYEEEETKRWNQINSIKNETEIQNKDRLEYEDIPF